MAAHESNGEGREHSFCPYCMNRVKAGDVCPVCGLTMGGYVPSPHHLPPGTVLVGRYLIGRVLGEGGFGITYIGCDLRLEMKVAVKEYFPADRVSRRAETSLQVVRYTAADIREEYDKGLKKFLNEARIMGRMEKQPQFVRVRDHFEANGTAYIVMEYVDGTTLAKLVEQKGGRIPPEELLPLLEPLFGALGTLHGAGLLHRDISPDNLMLERGKIRLLDLGCARETAEGNKTLTVALKQGYGPVEQYQGKGQGPWTDVYALSAIIYYCMTGRKPPQALDRMLEDELVPPRRLGVNLSPGQEEALMKGLAVNPAKRIRTMEELRGGLYTEHPARIPPEPAPVPPDPVLTEPEPRVRRLQPSVREEELQDTDSQSPDPASEPTEPDARTQDSEPVKPGRRAGLGILGGILAAVLIIAVLASRGTETVEPSTAGSGTEAAAGTAEETAAAEEDTPGFDGAYILRDGTEEELRELLASDEVTAVILTGDSFDVLEEELEITKPLLIEEGVSFASYQPVTVSGDGYLEIRCEMLGSGVLRTCGGGRISLAGELRWDGVLWLEQEENLTLEEGAVLTLEGEEYASLEAAVESDTEFLLILSVEDVFADALHVTTRQEYERAAEEGRAIVIDADMSLSDYMEITVPTMISEGVTVSIPSAGDSEDGWNSFRVLSGTKGNAVLVNYGTLAGDFQTLTYDSNCTVLNYGTMSLECVWLECRGQLFNYGGMTIGGHSINGTSLYNLGTVTCTGGEDIDWLDIESLVYNSGSWNLEAADGVENYSVRNFGGTLFDNSGTLNIGKNVIFENAYLMRNTGTLAVTDANAEMKNRGVLYSNASTSVLTAVEGAVWESEGGSTGLVLYSQDSVVSVPDSGPQDFMRFSWGEADEVWVSTEEELLSALADDGWHVVVIEGGVSLHVDDEVEVKDKVLALYSDASLTVEGEVGLTVSGENGGLYLHNDSSLDLEAGSLVLTDSASCLVETGGVTLDMGGLYLNDSSKMVTALYAMELEEVTLGLDGSTCFSNLNGISLHDCEICLNNGASWGNWAESGFYGGSILLEGGSWFDSELGETYMGSDVVIEEGSGMELADYTATLAGSVENCGELRIRYTTLKLTGSLINEGEFRFCDLLLLYGSLDNRGVMYAVDGAPVSVGNSASFTGEDQVVIYGW